MTAEVDLEPLAAEHVAALRAIRHTPQVYRWWGETEDDFPLADEPTAERFTVLVDGRIAGMVQVTEELEPRYRSGEIDIFLDPAVHGRGIGRHVVDRAFRMLADRGHHRVMIGTACENAAAIACYKAAGFDPVGVVHAAWRDTATEEWTDELLLERVELP